MSCKVTNVQEAPLCLYPTVGHLSPGSAIAGRHRARDADSSEMPWPCRHPMPEFRPRAIEDYGDQPKSVS